MDRGMDIKTYNLKPKRVKQKQWKLNRKKKEMIKGIRS